MPNLSSSISKYLGISTSLPSIVVFSVGYGFTLSNPATAGSTELQKVMTIIVGTLDFSEIPASDETRIYFDITLNFTGSLSTDIMQDLLTIFLHILKMQIIVV